MSEIQVNKISPATGTTFTLGDSGDTFNIPSGATIANAGTATGFGENNTPCWLVRYNGEQSLSDYTTTKVTWNVEESSFVIVKTSPSTNEPVILSI